MRFAVLMTVVVCTTSCAAIGGGARVRIESPIVGLRADIAVGDSVAATAPGPAAVGKCLGMEFLDEGGNHIEGGDAVEIIGPDPIEIPIPDGAVAFRSAIANWVPPGLPAPGPSGGSAFESASRFSSDHALIVQHPVLDTPDFVAQLEGGLEYWAVLSRDAELGAAQSTAHQVIGGVLSAPDVDWLTMVVVRGGADALRIEVRANGASLEAFELRVNGVVLAELELGGYQLSVVDWLEIEAIVPMSALDLTGGATGAVENRIELEIASDASPDGWILDADLSLAFED